MSATDELRELLYERGISYIPDDGECAKETIWKPADDVTAAYVDFGGGTDATHFEITYWDLSPEQAVAATVGTGACRLRKGETTWFAGYNGYVTEWTCDECGGHTFYDAEMRPRFCADCGRKVVK